MVDKHSQSFFGKSSGLTIQSSSRNEPFIFFKCIKKKQDGSWEKPSKGEGKTIKCSLDEMVMICEVLHKRLDNWSSYHNFNDLKTPISFKWENEKKERLYINIGSYSKMLNFPQIEVFRLLISHILEEKIEHATTSNFQDERKVNQMPKEYKEKYDTDEKPSGQVEGTIKNETQKALLINFHDDKECWIPKSAIRSNYSSDQENLQSFTIDTWLLEKNNIAFS